LDFKSHRISSSVVLIGFVTQSEDKLSRLFILSAQPCFPHYSDDLRQVGRINLPLSISRDMPAIAYSEIARTTTLRPHHKVTLPFQKHHRNKIALGITGTILDRAAGQTIQHIDLYSLLRKRSNRLKTEINQVMDLLMLSRSLT
jgi:hypothetical protein